MADGAGPIGGEDSGGQETLSARSEGNGGVAFTVPPAPPPAADVSAQDVGGTGSTSPAAQKPTSTSTSSSSSSSMPSSSSSSSSSPPSGKPTWKETHGEIYVDGAGKRFKCSSYWRGQSQINTWYEIDESGSRILSTSFKPASI